MTAPGAKPWKARIVLYMNGNMTVHVGRARMTAAEMPWLAWVIEWLESKGMDVEKSIIRMPDGRRARITNMGAGGWHCRITKR